MKRSDQELSLTYFLSDLFALNATLFVALLLYQGEVHLHYDGLTMVAMSIIWILCSSINKIYHLHLHNSFKMRIANYLKTHFVFVGSVSIVYLIFSLPNYIKTIMIVFVIAFPAMNLFINFVLFKILKTFKSGNNHVKKALIIGAGKAGINIYNHFHDNPDFGYQIIGFLEDHPHSSKVKDYVLGEVSDFEAIISQQHIDEVIIAISTEHSNTVKSIIKKADYHGVRTRLVPDYNRFLGHNYSMTLFGNQPIINVREINLDKMYPAAFKRIFDMVFSAFALICLLPVFLILAIAIKSESKGPVFYCPVRIGRNGKSFKLFKFRSMLCNDSATDGTKSTGKNDERITKIGRIIRKYSLDELPQFLNVLFGDMSVVGPRPHRVFLNQLMQKEVNHYMLRHYLKPGITGWAQVNGWRGPTETEEQKTQRTEHDLWYMENWTLELDFKIIYLTVFSQKTHQVAF